MIRATGVFFAVFAVVLAALFAAVGQLGKIDQQTLVVVLVAAGIAAVVAAWRSARRRP